MLSDINTYQDNDPSKVHLQLGTLHDDHGHLQGLWQVVDGKPLRQLCAYHYDDQGNLIGAQDENGAAWHYQHRNHLVTRYNLAWESSPPRDDGDSGRTVHYLYEPGSFVPVAQALRKSPIRLHKQPDWSQREYDFDQDPLWYTEVKPQGFDAIAWYQCDHLGTPMELTDEQGILLGQGSTKRGGRCGRCVRRGQGSKAWLTRFASRARIRTMTTISRRITLFQKKYGRKTLLSWDWNWRKYGP